MDLAEVEVLDEAGAAGGVDMALDVAFVLTTIKLMVNGPRGRGWPAGLDIGAPRLSTSPLTGFPVAKSPNCGRK